MAKRKTRVLVEITWDDELDNHPSTWDLEHQLIRNDFDSQGEKVRVVSFDDVEEHPVESGAAEG